MTQPAISPLSAGSTGAPYVSGNFAPLMNEVTAFDLEVVGRIPETLNGRFLRIGPNPVDEPDPVWLKGYHWFAGAGMAHGLRLRDGKAEWFRSRFVLDQHTAEVRRLKPIGGPGKGTRDTSVNTNFTVVGGKLCAIVEAGNLPVELDYELESVRRTDSTARSEAGFSGHPSSIRTPASNTYWHTNRSSRCAISRLAGTDAQPPRRGSICRISR